MRALDGHLERGIVPPSGCGSSSAQHPHRHRGCGAPPGPAWERSEGPSAAVPRLGPRRSWPGGSRQGDPGGASSGEPLPLGRPLTIPGRPAGPPVASRCRRRQSILGGSAWAHRPRPGPGHRRRAARPGRRRPAPQAPTPCAGMERRPARRSHEDRRGGWARAAIDGVGLTDTGDGASDRRGPVRRRRRGVPGNVPGRAGPRTHRRCPPRACRSLRHRHHRRVHPRLGTWPAALDPDNDLDPSWPAAFDSAHRAIPPSFPPGTGHLQGRQDAPPGRTPPPDSRRTLGHFKSDRAAPSDQAPRTHRAPGLTGSAPARQGSPATAAYQADGFSNWGL